MLLYLKSSLRFSVLSIFLIYIAISFWNVIRPESQASQVFRQLGLYPQFPLFTFLPGVSNTAVQGVCLQMTYRNQSNDLLEERKTGCEPATSWRDYQLSYMLAYPIVRNVWNLSAYHGQSSKVLKALLGSSCGQKKFGHAELEFEIRFQSFEPPEGAYQIKTSASLSCADRSLRWEDFLISKVSDPS
jgi:hypothetical protein